MTYPLIGSHRMAYDVDGSQIGYRYSDNAASNIDALISQGLASWLTSDELGKINGQTWQKTWGGNNGGGYNTICFCFWAFLPEQREITHVGFGLVTDFPSGVSLKVQGSNDSTNGVDGTWEDSVLAFSNNNGSVDNWRSHIVSVSFSGPKKQLRIALSKYCTGGSVNDIKVWGVHIYGSKAAGQTPDDIVFCDTSNVDLTTLKDLGDTPEGSTEIYSFKIKNASGTKIANSVNLQLNAADYGISFSADGPWATFVDISSIAPGSVSAPVYVKHSLGPPLLTLGPRAARVIATVGSWT